MSGEFHKRWIASKSIEEGAFNALRAHVHAAAGGAVERLSRTAAELKSAESFAAFYDAVDRLAEISREFAQTVHSAKLFCEWTVPPGPEFTDHFLNQYALLPAFRRTFWMEGPVLVALALTRGGKALELCCGSGYNSNVFYSPVVGELVCLDFDPRAIEVARRFHQQPNIRYEVADIRDGVPKGPFDNVVWDAAIEHFTATEIAGILGAIRTCLAPDGLLCGYTVAEVGDTRQHPDHEYEFKGMRDLGDLLKRHFPRVLVIESLHTTIAPLRHNLVFFASAGTLPFDAAWPRCYRP